MQLFSIHISLTDKIYTGKLCVFALPFVVCRLQANGKSFVFSVWN